MAYDVVPIQDSDGDEHGVVGDTLGAQFVPGYKIILGAKDVDGGFVAAGNPLPVNLFTADAANTARTTSTIVLPVQFVDDQGRVIRCDGISKSLLVIPYEHHEMHSGSFFFIKGWADVDGAGTNLDFLWVTPNTTKWAHAQWSIDGEAEFTLSLYEGVTTSGNGSALTARNANRNSATAATIAAYSGPTLAGGALGDAGQGGTLIWAGKIGSGKTATIGREISHEMIAKQNTKYWFRITKEAAGTAYVDYNFNWYEHTSE